MFDTTLTASRVSLDARRRFVALAAAVAVHALVVGFVTVGQLWAVDPVREYVVVPPLVVHLPPPLGGGGTAPRQPVRPATAGRAAREQVVQPAVVPEEIPRARNPETSFDTQEVPWSERLTDWEITGREIRTVPEQPKLAPDFAVEPPRRIGGEVHAPIALTRTVPQYPEVARRLRIQGVVLVEAVIDESGDVVDVRVLRDIGFGCAQAAVEAVRSWKYWPATLNGRPVSVYLEVRVSFRLHGAE